MRRRRAILFAAVLLSSVAWPLHVAAQPVAPPAPAPPAAPGPALRLEGHTGAVRRAVVSPDGTSVATASSDGSARVWDAATGKARHVLRGHVGDVTSVGFLDGGRTLVTGGADGTARVWDAETGRGRKTLPAHPRGVHALASHPDGTRFATAGLDGVICLWDAADGELVRRFRPDPPRPIPGGARPVNTGAFPCVAFSADGTLLAGTFGPFDPAAHVWDAGGGREVRRLAVDGEGVYAVLFSPDGASLAVVSGAAQHVRLFETGTWGLRRQWDAGRRPLRTFPADFSPDGLRLAAAVGGAVAFWDLATDRRLADMPRGHRGNIASVAYFPDGRRLLTGGADGVAVVWNVPALAAPAPGPGPAPRGEPLPISRLEQLWADLALEDAGRPYDAVWALAAAPEQAVAFVAPRLQADVPADDGQARTWIRALDDDDYAVREAASRSLASLGDAAEPLLREAMAAGPSPEVAQRLEMLLRYIPLSAADADALRTLRSLEVLERIGTPAARAAIESLAKGPSASRLARRARAALARLDRRSGQ